MCMNVQLTKTRRHMTHPASSKIVLTLARYGQAAREGARISDRIVVEVYLWRVSGRHFKMIYGNPRPTQEITSGPFQGC